MTAPAPEPRCAQRYGHANVNRCVLTAGHAGEHKPAPEPSGGFVRVYQPGEGADTAGHKTLPNTAPEPSGRMSEEEFEAIKLPPGPDVWRLLSLYAECRRARAERDALLLKYDALHDQRHEEARKADALRAEVARLNSLVLAAGLNGPPSEWPTRKRVEELIAERDALAERVRMLVDLIVEAERQGWIEGEDELLPVVIELVNAANEHKRALDAGKP